MARRDRFYNKRDVVVEEMLAVLLLQPSYDFHEFFRAVYESLRARKLAGAGEDVLRLRVYENLQKFVMSGLVSKSQKRYTAIASAIHDLRAKQEAAKAKRAERKAKSRLEALPQAA
jgi:hypothetical protein